jgi:hypothetical protein
MTIVKPSDNGIFLANKPYFADNPTNVCEKAFGLASETFRERFKGHSLAPNHPLDVLVRPESQYGGGYDGTKGENIGRLLPAILDYCANPSGKVMWTMAGKVEHLPEHKVRDTLKQRTICYPPGHFDILAKTYFEPFIDLFLELEKSDPTGCAYTKSIHGGGFHDMMAPLQSLPFLAKGDIHGFDRSHLKRIWGEIREIMHGLYGKEHHAKIDYILDEMWDSLVFMPNGDVVIMPKLKSGSPATTFMNCMVHLFVFMYMYYRGVSDCRARDNNLPITVSHLVPGDLVSWSQIYKEMRPLYYGDDHVLGVIVDFMATFAWRSRVYAELGFTLKKEDDLVCVNKTGIISPELTFLGNSPRLVGSRYVPVGNCEKYAQVFLVQSANSSEMARASQLYSYCLMSCFDDDWFGRFKAAYYRLSYHNLIDLPPQKIFQDMMSGSESVFTSPPEQHGAGTTLPVKMLCMDERRKEAQTARPGHSKVHNGVSRPPGGVAEASLVQIGNLQSRLANVASRHRERSERVAERKRHKHQKHKGPRKATQGPDEGASGSERPIKVQGHARKSPQGGIQSGGTAAGKPGFPRLDLVRYQEPRYHIAEDGSRTHTPTARGNIGIARSYSHGKNRASSFTKYRSKSWVGHQGIVFSGSELFDTIAGFNSQTEASPTMVLPLAPLLFQGTKLAIQAKMWQFWRFRRFRLRFISSLPTTSSGQIFLAYLDDVEQDIFAGPNTEFLRRISALKNVKEFQAWQSQSLEIEWKDEETPWSYAEMNGDDRLQTQGMVAAGYTIPVDTGGPSNTWGLVEIDYEVEFCDQIVEANSAATKYVQTGKSLGVGTNGTSNPASGTQAALAWSGPFWEDCTSFIVEFTSTPTNTALDTCFLRPLSSMDPTYNSVTITQGTVLYAIKSSSTASSFYLFNHAPSSNADDPLVWNASLSAPFTADYILRPASIEL